MSAPYRPTLFGFAGKPVPSFPHHTRTQDIRLPLGNYMNQALKRNVASQRPRRLNLDLKARHECKEKHLKKRKKKKEKKKKRGCCVT
jgi:hypothetical protein